MPFASFSSPVKAPTTAIWHFLMDKIQNPERYMPGVEKSHIVECADRWVVRRMKTGKMEVTERITVDEDHLEIVFELVDHPKYTGKVVNKITPAGGAGSAPTLTITLDWSPKQGEEEKEDMLPLIKSAVLGTKKLAEKGGKVQEVGKDRK